MKKFLLSLALVAFAASASMAQTANVSAPQVKKECCKDKKMDGKKCDKPADQQCPDCKAQAAKQCDKANKQCDKAAKQCDKAAAAQKDCCKDKKMAAKQCDKAGKQCDKAAAVKKDCCKDKKMDGKKCDKPADQQCPDCKEKAKKN